MHIHFFHKCFFFPPFLNSITSVFPCFGPNNGEASSPSVSRDQSANICRSEAALFFTEGWLSGSSERRTSHPFRRRLHFAWKTPPSHTHQVFSASAWERKDAVGKRTASQHVCFSRDSSRRWGSALADAVYADLSQVERRSRTLPVGGNNALVNGDMQTGHKECQVFSRVPGAVRAKIKRITFNLLVDFFF